MLNSDLAELFPGVRSVAGGVTFLKVVSDHAGAPRGIVSGEYTLGDVRPPFPPNIHPRPSLVSFKVLSTAPLQPGPGQYDLKFVVFVNHQGQSGNILSGMTETDVTFAVNVVQSIHYSLDANRVAPPALIHAPAEPDAPPLPPGVSAAPVYRPQPSPPKATTQANNPAPAPAPAAATLAPLPATPEAAPPPLSAPDFQSLSPFSGAQSLPPLPTPAPATNSN